jgi:hypothetical protein
MTPDGVSNWMLSVVLPAMEGRPEELTDLWAWLLPSVEDMMAEDDDKGSCRLSKSINDYDGKVSL